MGSKFRPYGTAGLIKLFLFAVLFIGVVVLLIATPYLYRGGEKQLEQKDSANAEGLHGLNTTEYIDAGAAGVSYLIPQCTLLLHKAERAMKADDTTDSELLYKKAAKVFNNTDLNWDMQPPLEATRVFLENYLVPEMTVAYMGCGTGSQLFCIAGKAKKVFAVDLSPYPVEFVKLVNKEKQYDNIQYAVFEDHNVILPDASLDAAFFPNGLEKVLFGDLSENPNVETIHQALKSKGIIFTLEKESYEDDSLKNGILKRLEDTGCFKVTAFQKRHGKNSTVKAGSRYWSVLSRIEPDKTEIASRIPKETENNKEAILDTMMDGKEARDYQMLLYLAPSVQNQGNMEASVDYYKKAIKAFNITGKYWDDNPPSNGTKVFLNYVKPGMSVGDLGCGAGYQLFSIAGKAEKVYAVDINPGCLEFIQQVRKRRKYDNVKCILCDKQNIMLEPDCIDVAYFRGSLRNIFYDIDSNANVSIIHRAIKEGGFIFSLEEAPKATGRDMVEKIEKTKKFKLVKYNTLGDHGYYFIMKKV